MAKPTSGCAGLSLALALGCASAHQAQTSPLPVTSAGAKPAAVAAEAIEMIDVIGGTFMMGGEVNRAHKQDVASFRMGRTEVTTAAYRSCVTAGACTPPVGQNLDGYDWPPECQERIARECSYDHRDREDHPINCIDFAQATAYCAWRGQRLPTDAEWEFAARGMQGRKYPWGEQPWEPERANLCGEECVNGLACKLAAVSIKVADGYLFTAPVASHPRGATPLAIEDMLGNVEELTSSVGFTDDRDHPAQPGHLGRGSSWASDAWLTYHNQFTDAFAAPFLGVRCAKDAEPTRR